MSRRNDTKLPETIHEQYNFLDLMIHTQEVNGEYTDSIFDQLSEIIFENTKHLPKNDDTIENASRCIESLTETVKLIQGWLEQDAKQLMKGAKQ